MMARLEREKQLELENMGYRRQVLEKEIQALRKDKERSDETIEDLQSQLSKLQTELDDSNELTKQLEKEKRDLRKEFEK
jgi:chromosome segregation ATPase